MEQVKVMKKAGGFTLIEVTLAIVIGIIMISGAVLIYNQAKQAAGNTRDQEKVASLQAVIEAFMARSDGIPPDVGTLRAIWQQQRPDDFNKSPWGGVANPTSDNGDNAGACQAAQPSDGILWGNCLPTDSSQIAPGATFILTNPTGSGPETPPVATPPWSGMLIYYNFVQTSAPTATFRIWDEARRQFVQMISYGVGSTDGNGLRWFFVKGGPTGTGDSGTLNAGGCVGC